MNKSQRFIIDCIKAGRCPDDYVAGEFRRDSLCYNPFDVISLSKEKAVENSLTLMFNGTDMNGVEGTSKITITYDPFADFQYFTSDKCVHDGTLLFLEEAFINIFNKLLHLETYYTPDIPEDFKNHVWDYNYEYVIGDFVVNNQIDKKYAPEDKPWCMERQIVCLPIKMRFVKKE